MKNMQNIETKGNRCCFGKQKKDMGSVLSENEWRVPHQSKTVLQNIKQIQKQENASTTKENQNNERSNNRKSEENIMIKLKE